MPRHGGDGNKKHRPAHQLQDLENLLVERHVDIFFCCFLLGVAEFCCALNAMILFNASFFLTFVTLTEVAKEC